jgi:hypothetical protein
MRICLPEGEVTRKQAWAMYSMVTARFSFAAS